MNLQGHIVEILRMVEVLMESRNRQKDLAEDVGTTQATINRILHGAMPSYDLGKRLEILYEQENVGRSVR